MKQGLLIIVLSLLTIPAQAALYFDDADNLVAYTGGNSAYDQLDPLQHDSGAYWWVRDAADGEAFVDGDTTYYLRKRTLSQLKATAEYQTWLGNNPSALPTVYAVVELNKRDLGVEETSPGITFKATLAAAKTLPATALPFSRAFGLDLVQVRTNTPFTFYATFTDGATPTYVLKGTDFPSQTAKYGIWQLPQSQFQPITVGGQTYQVKLVGYVDSVLTFDETDIEITISKTLDTAQ